jgi:hypothetical protein
MNKKKLIIIISAAVILIATGVAVYFSTRPVATTPASQSAFDARNASYIIEGALVTLTNGVAETAATTDSTSKIITRYFGNEARGDINGDGRDDLAFLLTQERGGTGIFYYAVAVLDTASGFVTTNTFFIGDRIAPQTINIMDGIINVNYAERKPGEPFTARPSIGVTKYLKVTPDGKLIETAQPKPVAQPSSGISVSLLSTGLSYSAAINKYPTTRIQFDQNCQATPTAMVLKSGATIMIDNRADAGKYFTIGGSRFYFNAYAFKIFTVKSTKLPKDVAISCGSGKNNAVITLN